MRKKSDLILLANILAVSGQTELDPHDVGKALDRPNNGFISEEAAAVQASLAKSLAQLHVKRRRHL